MDQFCLLDPDMPNEVVEKILLLLSNNQTFLILPMISKYFHKIVSKVGLKNNIGKKFAFLDMIHDGYLNILIWTEFSWKEFVMPDVNVWACLTAAKKGHLEVLKWLRSKNFCWDYKICIESVKNDHYEILKWAIENNICLSGHEWSRNTPITTICAHIAYNGRLDILKWLIDYGIILDIDAICMTAAMGGYLDILIWSLENCKDCKKKAMRIKICMSAARADI